MRRRLAALALATLLPLPALAAEVVVKSGETLSDIAARHGVSVNRLMQLNGIQNPDLVQAGTRLVLPGGSPPTGRGGGTSPGGGPARSHVVQTGETLSEIADRYGLSTSRLMQLNGIQDPNLVVAGTRLTLRTQAARPAASPSRPAAANAGTTLRHTVRDGETLSEIADRYGLSSSRLMQLNGIQDPDLVIAGSQLLVPVPKTAARPSAAAPARPSINRQAVEHVVRPGETLSDIAEAYKLPLERLISLNTLQDPDTLISGTRLKLRAPATAASKPVAPKRVASKPTTSNPVASKPRSPSTAVVQAPPAKPSSPKPPAPAIARQAAPQPAVSPAPRQATTPAPGPAATSAIAQRPDPDPAPPATERPASERLSSEPVSSAQSSVPQSSGLQPSRTTPTVPSLSSNSPASERPAVGASPTTAATTPGGPAKADAPASVASPISSTTSAPILETKPSRADGSFAPATPVAAAPRQPMADNLGRSPASTVTTSPAAAITARRSSSPSTPAERPPIRSTTTPTATATASPNPANPKTVAPAKATATVTAGTTATTARPATPDWRTYGPLQIDWANWYPMGGSLVAPSLNRDGQPLYLAVNCKARKINATSQAGQWNTWDAPQSDFELQLVNDICRQKGG